MRAKLIWSLWLSAFAILSFATAADAKIKLGDPAPKFTVRTLDGRKITAEELRGKVVVLNFWATWCVPCRAEMPLLDAFQAKFRDAGLEVFAVATEDSLSPRQLRKFQPTVNLTMARGLSSSYKIITGVPTNYVIDRRGIVRHARAGALDLDQLNALLIPLLREPVLPKEPPAL